MHAKQSLTQRAMEMETEQEPRANLQRKRLLEHQPLVAVVVAVVVEVVVLR